jgi:hypothetical protein
MRALGIQTGTYSTSIFNKSSASVCTAVYGRAFSHTNPKLMGMLFRIVLFAWEAIILVYAPEKDYNWRG